VYLGEHYAVDLLAGAALTETIRRGGPRMTPLFQRVSHQLQALETWAAAG
jgi:hypothetical protein